MFVVKLGCTLDGAQNKMIAWSDVWCNFLTPYVRNHRYMQNIKTKMDFENDYYSLLVRVHGNVRFALRFLTDFSDYLDKKGDFLVNEFVFDNAYKV